MMAVRDVPVNEMTLLHSRVKDLEVKLDYYITAYTALEFYVRQLEARIFQEDEVVFTAYGEGDVTPIVKRPTKAGIKRLSLEYAQAKKAGKKDEMRQCALTIRRMQDALGMKLSLFPELSLTAARRTQEEIESEKNR